MRYLRLAAVALFVIGAAQVQAQTFVGSYRVDQGPFWTTAPPVYSGVDAAALLFGGAPSDYSTSTVDNNPANIDHLAWVSQIFVAGGHKVLENVKQGGTNGKYDEAGDFSAYVQDNAQGPTFTNFVFRNAVVPELSSGFSLFGLLRASGAGLFIRRRRKA